MASPHADMVAPPIRLFFSFFLFFSFPLSCSIYIFFSFLDSATATYVITSPFTYVITSSHDSDYVRTSTTNSIHTPSHPWHYLTRGPLPRAPSVFLTSHPYPHLLRTFPSYFRAEVLRRSPVPETSHELDPYLFHPLPSSPLPFPVRHSSQHSRLQLYHHLLLIPRPHLRPTYMMTCPKDTSSISSVETHVHKTQLRNRLLPSTFLSLVTLHPLVLTKLNCA